MGVSGEEVRGILSFWALVCVRVYFSCSGGCLCQGLQKDGGVYGWFSRLIMGGKCGGERGSEVTSGKVRKGR
jgi:hypothetical protein